MLAAVSPATVRWRSAARRSTPWRGLPLQDGTIIVRDGKISSIGKSAEIQVPDGFQVVEGKVVVPGLIDAHTPPSVFPAC